MTRRTGVAWVSVLVIAGAALLWWSTRRDAGTRSTVEHTEQSARAAIAYYTCTMHPSVRATEPGRCPICNMDLVPVRVSAAGDTQSVDLTFTVPPAKQQLVGVTFASVGRSNAQRTVRAFGRVAADETRTTDVNLRVGGWIEDLYVDFTGRVVRRGEPLFTLYSPELLAAQGEFQVALSAAQSGGSAEEGARLVASARERLRLWQMTDDQIRALEAGGAPTTTVAIASPATGVVVEKMAVKGMRVEPGMTLYTIVDLSRVWVNADVYESELPLVHIGQHAHVTVPSVPRRVIEGTIAYIDPVLDPATRTARARLSISNEKGDLKPEMFVEVGIQVELGERLVVPESAVLRTGERQIVFVDKGGGVFEARLVTLGVRAGEDVEVVDGLHEGERVVASANFLIDAEAQVQGVLRRMEGDASPSPAPVHRH